MKAPDGFSRDLLHPIPEDGRRARLRERLAREDAENAASKKPPPPKGVKGYDRSVQLPPRSPVEIVRHAPTPRVELNTAPSAQRAEPPPVVCSTPEHREPMTAAQPARHLTDADRELIASLSDDQQTIMHGYAYGFDDAQIELKRKKAGATSKLFDALRELYRMFGLLDLGREDAMRRRLGKLYLDYLEEKRASTDATSNDTDPAANAEPEDTDITSTAQGGETMPRFPEGQEGSTDGPPNGVTVETIASKLLEVDPKKLALFARLQRATKGDGTVARVCEEEGIGPQALAVRNSKIFQLIGVGASNFKGRKELIRNALDLVDKRRNEPHAPVGEQDRPAEAAALPPAEAAVQTEMAPEEAAATPESSAIIPAPATSPAPAVANGHSNEEHSYPFALPVRIGLEHLGPIIDFDIAAVQLGAEHAQERQQLLAERQAQGMQVAELLLHPEWPSSQLVFVKRP